MQKMPSPDNRVFAVLQELVSLSAPSGHEESVRDWLRERWSSHLNEWHEDAVGNVIGRVGGSGPKLLLVAHMDEIGFVVRAITSSGFLLLDTAQGSRRLSPERRFMIGQLAQVVSRRGVVAEGIFAATSGHVMTQAQIDKRHLDFDDIFVDIGVNSRADAEALGVHVGAAVIWQAPARRVGSRIIGKAMDDRALLGVMDLLLQGLDVDQLQYELWYGATVDEECGRHGAFAIGNRRHFDLAVALDVGLVGDIPTVSSDEYSTYLGGGPTLVHKDMRIHYDKRIIWQFVDVAESNGITYQHGVYNQYGSDAAALIDSGIPACLVGLPTRYTHTAFEMVEEADIIGTVELLRAFVTTSHEFKGSAEVP